MTDLDARVGKLEHDVTELKVETGKISTTLENMKALQEERHAYVVKGIDKIEASLDTLTQPHGQGPSKWVKEVLTPQTITIILAILASVLGAPMVGSALLSSANYDAASDAVERIETQPSPSTQP